MTVKEQKYLEEIYFQNLENWSVQYLKGINILYNPNFKLVKIGDFLTRNKMNILIQDSKTYKRVTIKINNGGVFLRDAEIGSKIGTKKQFTVKQGQFIISKIDARNGAFGVVSEEVDNAIITGNFWTFDVNRDLVNPHFLSLMTTTPAFIFFCENASNGTTNRHYLQEDLFLRTKIPLPSLEEQNKIVEKYNQKIKEAENAEKKSEELEKNIEEYLMEELGIEKEKKEEKKKGLQEINFKDIFEWGIDKIIGLNKFESKKFEITNLEKNNSLYIDVKRGKSPKYSDNSDKFILNQKCNRWDKLDLDFVKTVKEDWFNSIHKDFFTKEGDVLINSTGEGTIGRASSINSKNSGLLYDSHLLLLRLNNQVVNYKFYTLFFNTKLGQEQIDVIKSAQATKQTELGVGNLKKISFPLPSLKIQEKIVEKISAMKEKIKSLKKFAEDNRKNAITGFEKEIFSE